MVVVVGARQPCQVYIHVPPEYVCKRENDTIYACSFRKCADMGTGATDSMGGDCASDPQAPSFLTREAHVPHSYQRKATASVASLTPAAGERLDPKT